MLKCLRFSGLSTEERETPLKKDHLLLRLNVGFILKENLGYSREFSFSEPEAEVSQDLSVQNLRGAITITRTPQGLYTQGQLQATAGAECVRCLSEFQQAVSARIGELFFYPPESAPEGAASVGEDGHLELRPLVREDFLLSMPIRTLCQPSCQGLCPICGQNWNDGDCDCETDQGDPRLAELRHLLDARSD